MAARMRSEPDCRGMWKCWAMRSSRRRVRRGPGDVERLDGADAETFDGGFIEDASEEILEFDARGKVAP